ncbi:MAG: cupin domain-containing protein [Caldilineaceae bacterium]|nr:cupin domain-containing protein [Caldilineaceae bacterium]
MLQPGQLNIYSLRNPHVREAQLVRLFEGEEIHAYMLVMPPGARVEPHSHENKHEIFDVLEGSGVIEVEGRSLASGLGRCVFVPAGVSHSLQNDGAAPWTLRITCQDRVYPRHLGKLIGRAIRKRLPWR